MSNLTDIRLLTVDAAGNPAGLALSVDNASRICVRPNAPSDTTQLWEVVITSFPLGRFQLKQNGKLIGVKGDRLVLYQDTIPIPPGVSEVQFTALNSAFPTLPFRIANALDTPRIIYYGDPNYLILNIPPIGQPPQPSYTEWLAFYDVANILINKDSETVG
ncbi:hypothetical protein MASR2M18_14360 [Ignavibacteria bacterium]|jgi:hypothetical protein|nr:hypothetical protein [Bacteroidota bacterium]MCZ2132058.1 hypothetical protein [Bacteroidota bacterium]